MKKSKKIVFLSATLGSVLGIVFIAIALLSVNFDVRNLDLCGEPQKITKECGTMEDLKDICIYLGNNMDDIMIFGFDSSTNIRVKESPDDKIHITYYTTDCCSKELEIIEQKLLLHETDTWIYNIKQFTKGIFHGAKQWGLETVIEIPSSQINIEDMEALADYLQTLADKAPTMQLKTNNGNIIIEKAAVSSLTAQTFNGYVSVSNIYTNTFDTGSSNGELLLNNIYAHSINAYTSNGSIILKNADCTNSNLSTSNGSITLNKISASQLQSSTSNGTVTLFDIKVNHHLSAYTSNGDIQLKNIMAEDMIFNTSNGSIWGNIAGKPDDYFIQSHTSLGNNVLAIYNGKNKNANKSIEAYTSNGDISITFSE